jgi:hypothetical protein
MDEEYMNSTTTQACVCQCPDSNEWGTWKSATVYTIGGVLLGFVPAIISSTVRCVKNGSGKIKTWYANRKIKNVIKKAQEEEKNIEKKKKNKKIGVNY